MPLNQSSVLLMILSFVDSTDAPYNSEGVPASQLRKLHLNDDDQAFMSKVKAQGESEITCCLILLET